MNVPYLMSAVFSDSVHNPEPHDFLFSSLIFTQRTLFYNDESHGLIITTRSHFSTKKMEKSCKKQRHNDPVKGVAMHND